MFDGTHVIIVNASTPSNKCSRIDHVPMVSLHNKHAKIEKFKFNVNETKLVCTLHSRLRIYVKLKKKPQSNHFEEFLFWYEISHTHYSDGVRSANSTQKCEWETFVTYENYSDHCFEIFFVIQ